MKIVTILSLFLLLLVSPAYGQLTKEDLRIIIREEVRPIIKEEITASEKRMKEYIDLKIDALDDKLSTRIDAVNEKLNWVWFMMIGLIALVTAAVAVPQIIMAYRERGQKEMETRQAALQTEIQQLRDRLAALENTPS